ncbi:MAG: Cupin domain protein [Ilumatobacteraceae bacterium]|nr:Cupin domain protein [Ilumatobacteraceae bacterium]MCU1387014.1 Cupin domain protein [Ilumatobacteraceae bacterium]
MGVRRVVTGHSADGKSIVASDEIVEPIQLGVLPGYAFVRVWGADTLPELPGSGIAPPHVRYFPPVGGFRFGLFTVPPAGEVIAADLDLGAAFVAMEEALPGMADHMEPDSPGMHTTATVDYEFVVSGSIVLELDDGVEVELGPGDTVVQNGTRHAWRNRGAVPCEMVVVLVGVPHAGVLSSGVS